MAGLGLMLLGAVAVLVAQGAMGTSWRIGVDEQERTSLVTGGVFAAVRNPVFTAMVVMQAATVLVVPTGLSLLALVCLVLGVELQVRVVEEPYLERTHGAVYRAYAARTGRFLPGIGRLPKVEPAVAEEVV